jgi:hypothetical protein
VWACLVAKAIVEVARSGSMKAMGVLERPSPSALVVEALEGETPISQVV